MQYVFIGGPSTGKTTIIEQMHKRGFATVKETARRLLEENSVPKPILDRDAFQREVFRQQVIAEELTLNLDEPSFLDGGAFDGCAYYLCDGLVVPLIYDTVYGSRYRCAFLFEALDDFVTDGIRYQDHKLSARISTLLENCYLERGVKVVRIPKLSVDERTEFLLSYATG